MLKKLRRKVSIVFTEGLKKRSKPYKTPIPESPLPPPPPPPPPQFSVPTTMPRIKNHHHVPFIFPEANSSVLPDPSNFFSQNLLSNPLPTNSFFQNFVLKNGDVPEFFHPYLIKPSNSSLSISHPPLISNTAFTYQAFNSDLTITSSNKNPFHSNQKISSYSDLSVTLEIPNSNLRFFLVRGSPFVTFSVTQPTPLSISTIHAILSFSSSNESQTKFTFQFNNGQTWILYASSPIRLNHTVSEITSDPFCGVIRIALLPGSDSRQAALLDRFSSCYPVSGDAVFSKPYSVEYKWEKKGGLRDGSYDEIVSALVRDVEGLNSAGISTNSSYFYGKLVARAARLALIAEEVCFPDVIPAVKKYLKETIEPWLNGSFNGNGFLYDKKWGGIVTKQGSNDSGADFGFGVYNDHHYHLGYFLYGIAVLAKIDPAWGRKYKPQAYSLMADFMTLSRGSNSSFTRLRCFDLYKLHSWAGGLTDFADGRNQESTSEAVNAYYSAALMGLAYGDPHLVAMGSMLTALEIHAAQMWWQVKEGGNVYQEDFTRENRVVGVLWANKRDSALWFAPPEWRECRLGIQLLPILPISEALFSDVDFVKQLVEWTLPALKRDGVGEGWKGFVYALQGVYDNESALQNIRSLNGFDDGNTLTNLLWWIHSRGNEDDSSAHGKNCWFGHYCH
ncbi:hypothetical protein PIB30_024960 [Stylosanthes scabra]|uniref:glucan endo-1,3-beta-D-glucosidase n=1 Tax=Stylosanthes scabra TaxID=79078 RepID=A0ABU6WDE6_9FABA|nr:hypothetical protein [Stylosanthes scabra]